jgi:hypothetical protein
MTSKRSRAQPAVGSGLAGLALLVTALVAACGGTPPPPPEVPGSFPAAALLALDSDSGALHVELRSAPDPLVRGQNVGQVTVVDQSGQPIDGLTLKVLPWMPSHGHGTSAGVGITDTGGGVFIANPLYLFMAGEWQLKMTFEGNLSDTATATVEIP